MVLITLTTDFGLKDHYVATLKGRLLRNAPSAVLVDISHQIPAYDIQQAAWVLRHAMTEFPPGSIHIVAVGSELSRRFAHIAVALNGQYIIGSDNGFFSLFGNDRPDTIVELSKGDAIQSTFIARDIYAPAALRLAAGDELIRLGPVMNAITEKLHRQHPPEADILKGTVVYIDSFGNLITDISREQFDTTGRGRKFALELIGDEINQLHRVYSDVPEGEKLALFNAANMLEIAINQGKAASLLSLRLNDVVRIVFES